MTSAWHSAGEWLTGPLCSVAPWPCMLHVRLGDLQPRFRVKQTIGANIRAIARNGRVLLCADRPLDRLVGQLARLRLQTWHRAILQGEPPQPYGVLLCVRTLSREEMRKPVFTARLRPSAEAAGELRLDVGGRFVLDFFAEN